MRANEFISEALNTSRYSAQVTNAMLDSLAEIIITDYNESNRRREFNFDIQNSFLEAAEASLNSTKRWGNKKVSLAFSNNTEGARFNRATYEMTVSSGFVDILVQNIEEFCELYIKERQIPLKISNIKPGLYNSPVHDTVSFIVGLIIHEFTHGVQQTLQKNIYPTHGYLAPRADDYDAAMSRINKLPLEKDHKIYASSPDEIGGHAAQAAGRIISLMAHMPKEEQIKKLQKLLSNPKEFVSIVARGVKDTAFNVLRFNQSHRKEKYVFDQYLKRCYELLLDYLKYIQGRNVNPTIDDKVNANYEKWLKSQKGPGNKK
jgi:hypothetical protein